MKIVYCIPSLCQPGGMERVLTEKVNYLSSVYNYEIIIITTEQNGNLPYFELDNKVRLVNFNLDFDKFYDANILKKSCFHFLKLHKYKVLLESFLHNENVDICVSLCGKEIDFLHSLKTSCKKVAELHFAMNYRTQFVTARHHSLFWKLLGKFRTWQFKRSVSRIDRLIVLTHQDFESWKKTHHNVILLPNPSPIRSTENANWETKNVLTIGKLDAQKGYDLLVEAWAIVKKVHPEWSLNIWGKGEWEKKLRERIGELGLDNSVFLRGVTNDIVSQYLNNSIYVLSSRYEGLPMVLIEAMSCGLPIVSFDCECGPRDLIKNGNNGLLIPNGNIQLLATGICTLMGNLELRQKMGLNSKTFSMTYSLEKIMQKWVEVFCDLVLDKKK